MIVYARPVVRLGGYSSPSGTPGIDAPDGPGDDVIDVLAPGGPHLLLSEIQAESTAEFLEIHNPTSTAVSLTDGSSYRPPTSSCGFPPAPRSRRARPR
jgi:hypothetical protein